MKIVFLLALAGLASCRSVLPGGDQARNVELEYTYIDEFGKPIRVKVQADLINLSGIKEVKTKYPEPRFVQLAPKIKEHDFKMVHPEPVVQHVFVPAPTPKTEFRYVVQPSEPRTIKVEVPEPQVRTIYVQAPAPVPFARKLEVEAPEPRIVYVQAPEPKTVDVEVEVPVQQPHRFVVPAPVARTLKIDTPEPEVRTVYIQAPVPRPEPEIRYVTIPAPRHKTLKTKTSSFKQISSRKSINDDEISSGEM